MTQRKTAKRMKIIHSLAEIPAFKSEDEERAWWDEHDLSSELYDGIPENTGDVPPIQPPSEQAPRRSKAS